MKFNPGYFIEKLELLSERLERLPLFAIFSLIYLLVFIPLASQKLIWDDEFFSLYIAKGGFSQITAALLTGADQHPPFFYWVTFASLSLLGISHIALRLPAILAVLLMALALFRLVGSKYGQLFGLSAGLAVINTTVFYYAYEARGYGLVLGFSALALLSWQTATAAEVSRNKRILALIALAVSLCCAISSHYYALAVIGPLMLGELTRSIQNRKLDLPVWLTLCSPIIPLFLFIEFIESARGYSQYFWAKTNWSTALSFYNSTLYYLGLSAILFISLVLAFLHFARQINPNPNQGQAEYRPPGLAEIVAVIGLLLLPIIVFLAAKIMSKGFHPRYVLVATIGAGLIVVYLISHLSKGNRVVGLLLCLSLLSSFICRGGYTFWVLQNQKERLRESIVFLDSQQPRSLPIAMAENSPMHMMSFYAPKKLSSRLKYLAEPESAIKYLDHDTIDSGMLDLLPWFQPYQAVAYKTFVATNPEFLVYGYIGSWSWLTYKLPIDPQLKTELVGRDNNRLLHYSYHADFPESSKSYDRTSPRAIYRDVYLGTEIPAEDWQTSFCSDWTNDSICRLGAQ